MGNLAELFDGALAATAQRVLAHLPQGLEALALLALGWLLARLLSAATRRGAALIDTLITRQAGSGRWRAGRSAPVLSAVVYWVVLLFFAAAATQALGLQTFTNWLSRLLEHLPTVVAGLLIIAAGFVLSGIVGDFVKATTGALAAPQSAALARIAQGATLLLAFVAGGTALAVALGARGFLANVIGAHYLNQALRVGQRVRVNGHEGRVVDITATSLVIDTPEGRVLLPGRVYHEEALTVLASQEVNDVDAR